RAAGLRAAASSPNFPFSEGPGEGAEERLGLSKRLGSQCLGAWPGGVPGGRVLAGAASPRGASRRRLPGRPRPLPGEISAGGQKPPVQCESAGLKPP
ncbi:unnamed protein product, partial [Gulo gulo]